MAIKKIKCAECGKIVEDYDDERPLDDEVCDDCTFGYTEVDISDIFPELKNAKPDS